MIQMTMLHTASVLLLLTAAGGLVMAIVRYTREANPPAWLAMAHGLLAASSLTLLIYAALTDGIGSAATAGLVLLLVAAGGGVIMNLAYQMAGKLLPKWLLNLHIALAVIGTGLVAVAAWG